jgi:hypothetical protein
MSRQNVRTFRVRYEALAVASAVMRLTASDRAMSPLPLDAGMAVGTAATTRRAARGYPAAPRGGGLASEQQRSHDWSAAPGQPLIVQGRHGSTAPTAALSWDARYPAATSVRAVATTSATRVARCSELVSGCRMQARSVSRPPKTVPVTKARPRA